MKLLCINDKPIQIKNGLNIGNYRAGDLKEGEIYTTRAKPFADKLGQQVYYIDGLGERLTIRFTELLDQEEIFTITKAKVQEPVLN